MQENVTSSGSFDIEIEGGFISPLFATETTAVGDRIAVLREPLIVIHDEVLSNRWIIQSLAEHALNSGKALLFIGSGVKGDALQSLVSNVNQGGHSFAAVKVSACGAARQLVLEDIATVTGGIVLNENLGFQLEHLTTPWRRDLVIGGAKMVRIEKTKTNIFGGGGRPLRAKNATQVGVGGASSDPVIVPDDESTRMGTEKPCERAPHVFRRASTELVRKTIRAVYIHAQKRRMKPPNLKEIANPVQQILQPDRYHAAAKRIQEIASEKPLAKFRGKTGQRVNGSFLPFSLEGYEKSGLES